MAISMTDEQADWIVEMLTAISGMLEELIDDYDSSEGVDAGQSLEQFLDNPIARAIWYIADVIEILESSKIESANDNAIPG